MSTQAITGKVGDAVGILSGDALRKRAGKLAKDLTAERASLYNDSVAAYDQVMERDPNSVLARYGECM